MKIVEMIVLKNVNVQVALNFCFLKIYMNHKHVVNCDKKDRRCLSAQKSVHYFCFVIR